MSKTKKSRFDTPYPYNDVVIFEEEINKYIKLQGIKNEQGSFIDLRKFLGGKPTPKGVRVSFEDFDKVVKSYNLHCDELKLEEEEKKPEQIPSQKTVINTNKRVKK